VGFVVDKVALGVFSPNTSVSPANIIPPLLHIHLSPPHEVCDCSDHAAHYHNLGPKLGASLLTRHIGWKQKQKERRKKTRTTIHALRGIRTHGFSIQVIKAYASDHAATFLSVNMKYLSPGDKSGKMCIDRAHSDVCLFVYLIGLEVHSLDINCRLEV
jgi:hypothetical protein